MDVFRTAGDPGDLPWHEPADDAGECAIEAASGIGGDDRRAQVQAHGRWSSLRGGRFCPSLAEMDQRDLKGPCTVLIELIEDKAILRFAGASLLGQCSAAFVPAFEAVPEDSLLACLITHYRQVLASREPAAFTGEHRAPAGQSSLYRGILLPLSSDGRSIDHVYGTISWRELADGGLVARLAQEVDRSMQWFFRERAAAPPSADDCSLVPGLLQAELPLRA